MGLTVPCNWLIAVRDFDPNAIFLQPMALATRFSDAALILGATKGYRVAMSSEVKTASFCAQCRSRCGCNAVTVSEARSNRATAEPSKWREALP